MFDCVPKSLFPVKKKKQIILNDFIKFCIILQIVKFFKTLNKLYRVAS